MPSEQAEPWPAADRGGAAYAQVQARGLVRRADLGDRVGAHIGFPVKLAGSQPALRHRVVELGEHTGSILSEFGYHRGRHRRVHARGAI